MAQWHLWKEFNGLVMDGVNFAKVRVLGYEPVGNARGPQKKLSADGKLAKQVRSEGGDSGRETGPPSKSAKGSRRKKSKEVKSKSRRKERERGDENNVGVAQTAEVARLLQETADAGQLHSSQAKIRVTSTRLAD